MTEDTYKKTIETVRLELVKLLGEREHIDKRILNLRQILSGFESLADDEEAPVNEAAVAAIGKALGITDAIRHVLQSQFPRPMAPREVRDELLRLGANLRPLSNQMASIHNILKRLVPNEAEAVVDADGKTKYRSRSRLSVVAFDKQTLLERAKDAMEKHKKPGNKK